MSRRVPALALVLLCWCGIAGCGGRKSAVPTGPSYTFTFPATVPSFSGDRAFELLRRQVEFGPRAPESAAHDSCAAFIESFLRARADSVARQDFSMMGYDGVRLHLRNISASFRPRLPVHVLLCAHWDSRPRADQETDAENKSHPIPGANDGASGVAVLLHLSELLSTSPPNVGIDLVFFDGEDYGRENDQSMYCLGSRYFSASVPMGYAPVFGILLDMVGDRDATFPMEGASQSYATDVMDLVWNVARHLGISRFAPVQADPITDDHVPLNTVAGIRTIDIIDESLIGHRCDDPRRRYWHTLRDTPGQCSAATLQDVGNVLTTLLYGLHPVEGQ